MTEQAMAIGMYGRIMHTANSKVVLQADIKLGSIHYVSNRFSSQIFFLNLRISQFQPCPCGPPPPPAVLGTRVYFNKINWQMPHRLDKLAVQMPRGSGSIMFYFLLFFVLLTLKSKLIRAKGSPSWVLISPVIVKK